MTNIKYIVFVLLKLNFKKDLEMIMSRFVNVLQGVLAVLKLGSHFEKMLLQLGQKLVLKTGESRASQLEDENKKYLEVNQ